MKREYSKEELLTKLSEGRGEISFIKDLIIMGSGDKALAHLTTSESVKLVDILVKSEDMLGESWRIVKNEEDMLGESWKVVKNEEDMSGESWKVVKNREEADG